MKIRRAGDAARAFFTVLVAACVTVGVSQPIAATQRDGEATAFEVRPVAVGELPRPIGQAWSGVADESGTRLAGGGQIGPYTDADEPARSPAWGSYGRDADALATPEPGSARLEIRLAQAQFDPLREGLALLPLLARDATGSHGNEYRIVQFEGPIQPSWRSALLDERDVEIIEYVPDFAYLVRIGADAGRSVNLEAVEGVRWVGPFAPAFRLSSDLLDAALAGRSDQALELTIRGFVGEPVAHLLAQLQAAGAQVERHGEDSGGGVIIRATAPASALIDLASIGAVAWIEPRSNFTLTNSVSRSNQLIAKDHVEQQLGLYGAGQIVAVVDSGMSTGNVNTVHADFAGRVLGGTWGAGNCGTWADTNSHGTHVSGSILGSGVRSGSNPNAGQYSGSQAGIAPRASLLMWATCDDFSGVPDTNPYQALWAPIYGHNEAVRISNNSWGTSNNSGLYNAFTRETDRFISDYFFMTIVFSSGNAGTDDDGDGVSDMGTLMPPSTGKNLITVGASENLRSTGGFNPGSGCATYGECWPNNFPVPPLASDRVSNNPDGMVAFSGRGPTRSNRLKPDIVAPGTNVVSARSEMTSGTGWGVGNQYYLFMGGTSMATPLVSGGAAVVREFFQRGYNHNATAALVKATLLNGAYDMTPGQYGTGPQQDVWRRPDVNQGWGTMELARTVVHSSSRASQFFEVYPGLQTSQQWQSEIMVAAAGSELRVQLVWIDKPGMEASHGALVNDLDLEVVAPNNTVHYGFAGLVGEQRDRFNNLEGVRIASAAAGRYVIRVRGYNVPMGPQPFSMAINGHLSSDVIFRNGFESGN